MSSENNNELADKDRLVGTTFADKYEILSLIENGSTCRIYQAKRVTGDKAVVIKVLHDDLAASKSASQCFMQEAKLTGSVSHPGIVRVIDFGCARDGFQFLVLELLSGKALSKQLADSGPLSPKTAVSVFKQICSALTYCHNRNIIYLGLNPNDIILSPTESGTPEFSVKLIDFWFAKTMQNEFGAQPDPGQDLSGLALYMSPEQRSNKALNVRSDIYSLGCVLYEALSGRPPYSGKNLDELNRQHLSKSAPPSLVEENREPAIPASLEEVVFKCMERDPLQRYETMAEVANDLSQSLKDSKNQGILGQLSKLFGSEIIASPFQNGRLLPAQTNGRPLAWQ